MRAPRRRPRSPSCASRRRRWTATSARRPPRCWPGWTTATSRSSASASTTSCTHDDEDRLRRDRRTPAWASCASRAGAKRAWSTLTARASALAREPPPLVLTKANTRSTVHRPAYLDYVGVKRFDAGRRGRRRAALPRALHDGGVPRRVARDPGRAAQGATRSIARAAFPPASHAEKALVEILDTYPRDELFQIPEDELFEVAMGILALGERQRVRLFIRRDAYERFVSCLVFLPRDRFNTRNRERIQEILADAFDAESVDFELRLSESVLVRIHFTVRLRPGGLPALRPRPRSRQRIVEATGSWTRRRCARRCSRRPARSRAPRCTAATATRSRSATATTGSPARRSRTSAGSSGWPTTTRPSRSASTTRWRPPTARCAASSTAGASR